MELQTWVAARKGRSAELAAHFELTPSAVSQWLKNGVPVHRMKAVRDFTGGEVGLEDLIPAAPSEQAPA